MTESVDTASRDVNLYLNRNPQNHIKDGEPRALYWESYRRKYEEIKGKLIPGTQVPLTERVCILANNNLGPHDFDLRKKDWQTMNSVEAAGISACVYFSDNPHETCGAIMDRDLKRQDAVYSAPVSEVLAAGWVPVFAPTPNQPLHLRIIPTELVGSEPKQPPIKLRRDLVEVFKKNKVRRSSHPS